MNEYIAIKTYLNKSRLFFTRNQMISQLIAQKWYTDNFKISIASVFLKSIRQNPNVQQDYNRICWYYIF
jgi:hypothetical protein